MTVRSTVQVVWRPDREQWAVEGGHGTTATLGIVSLHDSKVEAIREAHRVAREHGVRVEVIGEQSPPPGPVGDH